VRSYETVAVFKKLQRFTFAFVADLNNSKHASICEDALEPLKEVASATPATNLRS